MGQIKLTPQPQPRLSPPLKKPCQHQEVGPPSESSLHVSPPFSALVEEPPGTSSTRKQEKLTMVHHLETISTPPSSIPKRPESERVCPARYLKTLSKIKINFKAK